MQHGDGDLGWVADPQGPADPGLFGAWGSQTAAPGAAARVRTGLEPGRGDLELPETGGAQEPLLLNSLRLLGLGHGVEITNYLKRAKRAGAA